MDSIRVACDHCQAKLKAPAKLAGKRLKCPKCNHPIVVPETAKQEDANYTFSGAPQQPPPAAAARKRCPYCKELIAASAIKCRHCGEFLDAARAPKRRSKARAADSEMMPAEYLVAIAAFPIGLIIGLIWYSKKLAKAKTMLQVSGLMSVVTIAGLVIWQFLPASGEKGADGLDMIEVAKQHEIEARNEAERLIEELRRQPPTPSPPSLQEAQELAAPPDAAEIAQQPPEIQTALRANVRIELTTDVPIEGSMGSGVIVAIEGASALVLTNRHVVDRQFAQSRGARTTSLAELAKARVHVVFVTKDTNPAEVAWVPDDPIDLTILRVGCPQQGIEAANWRSMPAVTLGETVSAVGNPLGIGWTRTAGVVSRLSNRKVGHRNVPIIQTDTAINPGNSGGGLYNGRGELVGINTRIVDQRLAQNVGFAIRISVLQDLQPPLLNVSAAESAQPEQSVANAEAPAEQVDQVAAGISFSSPEAVLTEFFVALMTGNKELAKALMVPHPNADLLFRSNQSMQPSPRVLATFRQQFAKGMTRLKVGDRIGPPGQQKVLTEEDVNESRMVIRAGPSPTKIGIIAMVRSEGKWKIDTSALLDSLRQLQQLQ